jgi:hypothetical protein
MTFIGWDLVFAEATYDLLTPITFKMIYRIEYWTYQVLCNAYGLQTFS